jgi:hypothetical protein
MQSILDGPLEFCKQDAKHIDKDSRVALADVIDPSPKLLSAIEELLKKTLIKRDGRYLSVHRVVQEATTYGDLIDLQTSFDAAVRLVHYRFPETEMDGSLFSQWSICQEYIPHGVNLSKRFVEHTRAGALKGSVTFVELMSNCAWLVSCPAGICINITHLIGISTNWAITKSQGMSLELPPRPATTEIHCFMLTS